MEKINFVKMSGAGNDFIIIDARKNNRQFTEEQISTISDRDNIGCDQFILLKGSQKADIMMDIYNSDGSSSAACGNATRCVSSIIMKENNSLSVDIETRSGILKCYQEGGLISVNMGLPKFDYLQIPLSKEMDTNSFKVDGFDYEFSAANMGNPHIVTFLNEAINDESFFLDAPVIETNSLFPQKVNIEFAQIISSSHIKVRVWERGAGETLSCGSGACAVAVVAIKKGLVANDKKIKISFKGGDLFIEQKKNGSVIMTGDYKTEFSGVINEELLR